MEPGFQQLRLNGSWRSAFVTKAEDGTAHIKVSQPSDCLALQREHVVCTDILVIVVQFGDRFTSQINGPQHPEPPEVWQTALYHLLNTYKPRYCYIYTGGAETGLAQRFELVGLNVIYTGYRDDEQHKLFLSKVSLRCSELSTYWRAPFYLMCMTPSVISG